MFSVLAALVIAACGGGSDSQVFGSSGGGGVCTPATFRCTGDDLERCTDDGKGYAKVVTCPVKGLCDAMGGQCDVCKPGSGTCVDGSNIAACSADGQKVENKACDAATPFCASSDFGDHCVGCTKSEDCAASANECALALCGKDGTCATQPIAKDTPCGAPGAGGKCDGAGKCVSCIDGEKKCDGAVPSLCTAGSWIALPACSGDKAVCNAGECVACAQPSDCAPSANECLSASCSAQHSCGFSAKAQNSICMGGAGKCDGAGQCDVCQPGTKVCNGDAILACGNNGQYGAPVACGGATPKCDPQSAACVACYDGSQCPQSGNACLQAACTSNQCGFVPKVQGAACPGGTCNGAGQCYVCQPGSTVCSGNQVLTCNAMGQYDAPLVCSGGTPYCDPQSPSCVQCVSAANCPASGSSCITATCNGNACGFANVPNGTACMVGSDAGSCSSGACNVCANGTTRCKAGANDVPQLCVSGGWVDQAACGGAMPLCVSGACAVACSLDQWPLEGQCFSNLAPSASVSQSSTYTSGGCDRAATAANDGAVCWIPNGNPLPGYDTSHLTTQSDLAICAAEGCGNVQHTNAGDAEYWQADLMASHVIRRVHIWFWEPGGYRVETSSDQVSWQSVDFIPANQMDEPYAIDLNVAARYVRVQRIQCNGSCHVATQEIEIFGK